MEHLREWDGKYGPTYLAPWCVKLAWDQPLGGPLLIVVCNLGCYCLSYQMTLRFMKNVESGESDVSE